MTDLSQQMQQLYQQFGSLPGITIELHKELIAVAVANRSATARVFLQGAQLSQYQPTDSAAIIWNSEHNDYRTGSALRGGIPICWPWFGDLARNPGKLKDALPDINTDSAPAHGFVRKRYWQLDDITIVDEYTTQLLLTLSVSPEDYPGWYHRCDLSLFIEVGKSLTLKLATLNQSDRPLPLSQALHSYLAVADIDEAAISGFENSDYLDCLEDSWPVKKQQGAIGFDREVDRIYQSSPQPIILDRGTDRVDMTSAGSNSTVIWNPWIEKSQRLSQFDNQDYRRMLCIETANVDSDIVSLAPGQSHSLQLTVAPAG